jgi:hypothetical protein
VLGPWSCRQYFPTKYWQVSLDYTESDPKFHNYRRDNLGIETGCKSRRRESFERASTRMWVGRVRRHDRQQQSPAICSLLCDVDWSRGRGGWLAPNGGRLIMAAKHKSERFALSHEANEVKQHSAGLSSSCSVPECFERVCVTSYGGCCIQPDEGRN